MFISKYLIRLITTNVVKITFLIIYIIFGSLSLTTNSHVKSDYKVITKFESKGNVYYIVKNNSKEGWINIKKTEDVVLLSNSNGIISLSFFILLPLNYYHNWDL